MFSNRKLAAAVLLTFTLLVPTAIAKKRDSTPLKRSEIKEAERRLREMGYSNGQSMRQALISHAQSSSPFATRMRHFRKTSVTSTSKSISIGR
jgi:hypothetical protein